MERYTFTLENEHGMHARPAALFVQMSSQFQSEVFLSRDDIRVNGKSIIGVLRLGASKGDQLTIEVDGTDEVLAMEAFHDLLKQQFGE